MGQSKSSIIFNLSLILLLIILFFFLITGKFRMVLKLIVRYVSNKDHFSRLFHLASVDYKDDINVLQETVLDRIGESLRELSSGGKFIIDLDESHEFILSFSDEGCEKNDGTSERLCDVAIHIFVSGDL